ncbi:MAG: prolyl oligopeptidase family serine peptidase [Planctomycetaceae bacterium]
MPWRVLVSLWSYLLMAPASLAAELDDPHLWLEEVTGEKPLEWVRERNAESLAALAESDGFRGLERRLLSILDSKEKIPFVAKIGERYYNFWRDAQHPKGVWRRATPAEYAKPEPAWETVLDVDALAKAEGENWVWHGATVLEPEDRLVLVSLSRGGADADVVREFDLETKAFVPGGFGLPEAKSRVAWKDRDAIFVATDFGPGSLTASGYPRTVREWRRGTPLAEAEVVFEGKPDDMSVEARRDLTPGFERDFVVRQMTFWTSELFLRRDGRLVKVEKPDDANASVHREWLLVELRSPWAAGGTTHPAGSLLAADFERFLAGDHSLQVIFAPRERVSLTGFSGTRNHLLVATLDNVRARLSAATFRDGTWRHEPLPGVPECGTATAAAVDDLEGDDYFLVTASSLQPSTLAVGTVGGDPPRPLKRSPAFFDAAGLTVAQHEAVSKDGTRIPYFQIGPADLPADGSTPTLLYGYGGFEIPLVPDYLALAGAAWLERKHVYVIANIRGGGEFGPAWHQAALKEKRPRAYEDFIAVAEDLVARKVTSPRRLGIKGGSNGGLLMGNMYEMRPDLFGAVVCQVPLLDMRRFNKLLAGASWMGEYGDPDVPEEWAFIRGFSPYHNVARDRSYPPLLITTSTRDDRVHPGHARKMAALLREFGKQVLYYENIEGGHGGAADNRQKAFMEALGYTFLERELTRE